MKLTHEQEMSFLINVHKVIKQNPNLLDRTINMATKGTQEHILELRSQVADFETIAVGFMSMSKGKYNEKTAKWAESMVLSKLNKHKEHSCINWSSSIEELENKVNKEYNTEDKL